MSPIPLTYYRYLKERSSAHDPCPVHFSTYPHLMLRGTISLFLSFSFCPGFAQFWCPPGATWTYTHSNCWTHEGFARYSYVGDTLIAGTPA